MQMAVDQVAVVRQLLAFVHTTLSYLVLDLILDEGELEGA